MAAAGGDWLSCIGCSCLALKALISEAYGMMTGTYSQACDHFLSCEHIGGLVPVTKGDRDK